MDNKSHTGNLIINFSKVSVEEAKNLTEGLDSSVLIYFELDENYENKRNIKIADLFRELNYKKHRLKLKAPRTKFLRNLYEGYVLQINGDWIYVQNFK